MKIILRSVIFLQLIQLFLSLEQLIVEEFTSQTFTSADITNWSVKQVLRCETTSASEFSNSDSFGLFGKVNSSAIKTVNSFPPHWSVNVRFDMLLYTKQGSTDYINIQIDAEPVQKYEKYSSAGSVVCSKFPDILILYDKNLTHSASTLTITMNSITNDEKKGFVMKNLFIYVDTCHQSCETCRGPDKDQCLTCPINSTQSGNTCSCDSGYFSHKFTCISSCPSGFTPDSTNKICVIDFCIVADCQTCVNKVCTVCASGKKLLSGQCVSSCPSYAPEIQGICIDMLSTLKNGQYLIKGLFSDNFSQSEVFGLGFTQTGFFGGYFQPSGALVTKCGTKSLFGGAYLTAKGSSIKREFIGLAPHSQIIIGYALYQLDNWSNYSLKMNIDGVDEVISSKESIQGNRNICGVNTQIDNVIYVSKTISHTATTLTLQFTSNLGPNPFLNSFGIREIFILIDYCLQGCSSCNVDGCLKCKEGFYFYQKLCYSTCPERTYPNKLYNKSSLI